MKRRIARKIDNYKVMPQRLTNKAMYLYLRIREHWSLSIRGKNYTPATSWTSGDVSSSTHAPIPEDV